MVRALAGSDGAVSRGDLVEVSSQNSVDRYLQRLRALDIVERVGPGEYRAYLEPWWVSGNGQSEPYSEAYDGEIAATGLGTGGGMRCCLVLPTNLERTQRVRRLSRRFHSQWYSRRCLRRILSWSSTSTFCGCTLTELRRMGRRRRSQELGRHHRVRHQTNRR